MVPSHRFCTACGAANQAQDDLCEPAYLHRYILSQGQQSTPPLGFLPPIFCSSSVTVL